MALYQSSVLQKYLATQNEADVKAAYQQYTDYFHNPKRQAHIRAAKEEQYQEGFLRELFVNILGYTINPDPDFNITTELKNLSNAKKTDGAILRDGKALAVIELKGTDTRDLDKVSEQAFAYKNNQPDCVYVITSNFEKLRFFIHHAVEHVEFKIFQLSYNRFALLWLFLQKDNLLSDIPLKVQKESLLKEEEVTKRLYKDYAGFKQELWQDMVKNNVHADELELYKKSQKLLDRFLFIFFAEDKGLLPPNSISVVLKDFEKLRDLDAYTPLYRRFQKYFGYMNTGFVGKKYTIPAYNGGLFKPDELLNSLTISDDVLHRHTLKLSEYDFQTEVDVNILGHIFEHSLNDIENVRAQLAGETVDKSKTKRKKDGVFYTPKYITKYIVDNTVGRLCEEKKAEIGIEDAEFSKSRKGRKKATLARLDKQLKDYRTWLLGITICDPACGSGAFLNQALNFLIAEHRYIDELEAQLLETSMIFPDVESRILEQNIYGVDINEESVEIARLSLWLRTAKKGRKLNSLSNHIKVGNSLIDDPEVAGDLAFDWEKEFPNVFAKGGFDVVVGNPPYVRLEAIRDMSAQLARGQYETFDKRGDLYQLFVERGMTILKKAGLISYIMPNKWLQAGYGKKLREFLLKTNLIRLIDFGDIQVFQGATTYPCILLASRGNPSKNLHVSVLKESQAIDFESHVEAQSEAFDIINFSDETWVISSNIEQKLLAKFSSLFESLSTVIGGTSNRGVLTGFTEAFIIDQELKEKLINEDSSAMEIIKPVLRGRDIIPWLGIDSDAYLICTFPSLNIDIEQYPSIKNHLLSYGKERLEQSGNPGSRKKTANKWFETQDAIAYYKDFQRPKIMYQTFQVKPCFIFDDDSYYCNNSIWIIPTDSKALVALLNSKMGWWLITKYCTQIQNGCQLIWKYFGQIPVPDLTNAAELEELSAKRIESTAIFQKELNSFVHLLQSKFPIDKPSKKLQNWPSLDFKGFLGELKKKKVKLTLDEEAEWMEYFTKKKAEALALQSEIDRLDREIDEMVYALYGLTEEEIKVVEGEA